VKRILAAKQGALSDPVETAEGWALFRVTGRREPTLPGVDEALPAARAAVRKKKLAEKARAALEAVRQALAKGTYKTIEDALDAPEIARSMPGMPMAFTTGYLDRKRAFDYAGLSASLRAVAFDTPVGKTTEIVGSDETLQFARVIEQKSNRLVKVQYVPVRASLFNHEVTISDAEAREYFDRRRADYKLPLRYEIEALTARAWKLEDEVEATDEEIAAAHEQLKARFKETPTLNDDAPQYKSLAAVRRQVVDIVKRTRAEAEARKLAEEVRRQAVEEKKEFAELATTDAEPLKHTESAELSADGDRGPYNLRRTAGLAAFLRAAKPGAVSGVLPSPEGPVVVRLKAVHPAADAAFAEVEEEVRADARREQTLAKARGIAAELREELRKKLDVPAVGETKPDEIEEKIIKPTLQAMDEVAAGYRVATKRTVPIQVQRTPPMSRTRTWPACRRLAEHLLRMRFCEVTPQPVMDGEKADYGYLALLAETSEGSPDWRSFRMLQQLPSRIRMHRLEELVESVLRRFRQTRQPTRAGQ
jgi:hypothetical protein